MENSIMTFEEFIEVVEEEIVRFLPDEFQDAEISIKDVKKPGSLGYKGLEIHRVDDSIAPTFNLEQAYALYSPSPSLDTFERILSGIADACNESQFPSVPEIPEDYNEVRDHLFIKMSKDIINNPDNMEFVSFTLFDIRAIVVIKQKSDIGITSIYVTKELLDNWNVDEQTVINDAVSCLQKEEWFVSPAMLMLAKPFNQDTLPKPYWPLLAMLEIMEKLSFEGQLNALKTTCAATQSIIEADLPMITLSNRRFNDGAAVMLCPEVLDKVCAAMDAENMILLPSSVSEVLLVPCKSEEELNAWKENDVIRNMVPEVNSTVVPSNEILSNNAFIYTKGGGIQIL